MNRATHILGLSAFAITWPILDLLRRHADFLVVHRCDNFDIAIMVALLLLGAPAVLVASSALATRIHEKAGELVHRASMALLFTALVIVSLNRLEELPGWTPLFVAAALTAGFLTLYIRREGVRGFVGLTVFIAPVFVALFVFDSNVKRIISPREVTAIEGVAADEDTPVVLIVFDELPLSSLVDHDGIDRELVPNFARLADESIWFRDATAVSDATLKAIPAILTGRYPERDYHATLSDHPLNLFTLLGDSRPVHALEPRTRLCPEELNSGAALREQPGMGTLLSDLGVLFLHMLFPEPARGSLPQVGQSWLGFRGDDGVGLLEDGVEEKGREYLAWLDGIDAADANGLFFAHTVLPHAPYRYLASGKIFSLDGEEPSGEGSQFRLWSDDRWAALQSYQRHLLQLGYVDYLLGLTIARLQEQGIYDEALFIVTADHGVCFRAGDRRRQMTETNVAEIMRIPLFVKLPGQTVGEIRDDRAESIDILPTIVSTLGIQFDWPQDGRSLLSGEVAAREQLKLHDNHWRVFDSIPSVDADVDRRLQLFASGIFALGDRFGIVGTPADGWIGDEHSSRDALLLEPSRYADVDLTQPLLPMEVRGDVTASEGDGEFWIAVGVNGQIEAVTRPYENLDADGRASWSALIPERSLVSGENRIELFEIVEGDPVRLAPLQSPEAAGR